MKQPIAACLALLALTAIHCLAAEPAAEQNVAPRKEPLSQPAAEAPQPVIPEREVKFEVSEEELPTRLFEADPGVLDLRYVGIVRLEIPDDSSGSSRGELGNDLFQLYSAASRGRYVGAYHRSRTSRTKEWRVLPSLSDNMPKERQLPKDIASMFVDPVESRRFLGTREAVIGGKAYLEIEVRATTVERAKQLVLALLSLYDYGLTYPMQKEFLRLKQEAQESLVKDRAFLEQQTDVLRGSEEKLDALKDYRDISQETLGNFTTQLRLISVDLAGINARIEACNRILANAAEKRLPPSRIDQVETVKITAEIELLGAAARKAATQEIVDKGRQRLDLLRSVETLRGQVRKLGYQISETERRLERFAAAQKLYMPFPVQDGKVTIRPVKWDLRPPVGYKPRAEGTKDTRATAPNLAESVS